MLPSALIAAGALGIALTTSLEVVTAPYSAHVVAYPLNGAVHLVKVLAVAVFVAGIAGYLVQFRQRVGVAGSTAATALAVGTVLGGLPYNLAEASLDPALTPAAANERLEAIYAAHPWIAEVAGAMLPVVLLAIIVFGIVALRRRLFPAWAPAISLGMIPVAIGAVILAEGAGLPLPHPPAWLFLGVGSYGVAGLPLPSAYHGRPPDAAALGR
ncbi:MAG: hypothetical protein M3406_01960 [Chloroflexota bacterium]|nr:hypothetical protein [Chloroflexota bacterium]